MDRALPVFSFKKYLGSKIINIENIETIPDIIIESIHNELLSVKHDKEEIGLIIITLFEGNWEIRIWIEQNNYIIVYNINNNYKNKYKMLIEFFLVNRQLMLIDMELLKNNGFEPIIVSKVKYEALRQIFKSLILDSNDKEEIKYELDHMKQVENISVIELSHESMDWKHILQDCLDILWDTCFKLNCTNLTMNSVKMLEKMKIMIFNKNSEYICIVKELYNCEYVIIWNRGNNILNECKKFDDIRSIIDDILKKGYEPVIPIIKSK